MAQRSRRTQPLGKAGLTVARITLEEALAGAARRPPGAHRRASGYAPTASEAWTILSL